MDTPHTIPKYHNKYRNATRHHLITMLYQHITNEAMQMKLRQHSAISHGVVKEKRESKRILALWESRKTEL